AVGPERVAPAVELVAPRIAHPLHEDLQVQARRTEPPDARAAQPPRPARRLDMAVDVDRLVEVERAVGTPAERVDDVVRVLGAEAREEDAALVGLAVAVRVLEVDELGAVGDVAAAVARLDARRNVEALREDGRLVGLAVAVGV